MHKHVNRPETFAALVDKLHSYGIMVFGLFMYGFDGDDISVFDETVDFNINTKYDACAYSVLTPYPGTLTWYEMKKANRIVSFDWEKYDQGHVVFRPAQMSGDELRLGQSRTYETFYSLASIASRFPNSWPTPPYPVADLQHIYAQSLKDGIKTHRFNRGAHGGARYRPNASYPAGQARMACGRA